VDRTNNWTETGMVYHKFELYQNLRSHAELHCFRGLSFRNMEYLFQGRFLSWRRPSWSLVHISDNAGCAVRNVTEFGSE